ncbi:MAG: hypothetical protein WC724_00595 [Candidatus Paceibacterota bacterium]|jgi:hypothetical protein
MSSLEIGQKVFVHTPDETFFDSGRILDIKQVESGPDAFNQIAIKSDALDGEEVIFRFLDEVDGWVRFFQDPLENPGSLVYSQRESTYKIFGVED